MAGTYVELFNPGYSAMHTRDLTWVPNTNAGEAATLNAMNPDSAAPLYEGEWLEMDDGTITGATVSGTAFLRAGANTPAAAAAATGLLILDTGGNVDVGTAPAYLYFQERGRYDAQVTGKAHCLTGPVGSEFRTRMCVVPTTASIGDRLYVAWGVMPSGDYVRVLTTAAAIAAAGGGDAVAAGDWFCGTVTRLHAANDVSVRWEPGFTPDGTVI